LKDTLHFGSPNYALFVSIIARTVLQNPELYAQIQLSNPYNKRARESFVRKAQELEILCNKGNAEELKNKIIEETKLFKDPDASLLESDKAVNAFNYVISMLKSYTGKKFLVENALTRSFHYGLIKEVTGNELVMIEGQNQTKIHLSKVRLTTKGEMLEWKKKNLKERTFDYSFMVSAEGNPKIIINALNKAIRECQFELLGEYTGKGIPEGQKSITLRAHFFEDENKKEIDEKTKEILKGLGFVLR